MQVKLYDFDTEKYVLAACLSSSSSWSNFPDEWLTEDLHKKVYNEFKKFLQYPYNTFPTVDLVIEKTEDSSIKVFVAELSTIPVDIREVKVKLYDLFEMYAARKVLDVAKSIPDDLRTKSVFDVIRNKITDLVPIVNPFDIGITKRGFVYESAMDRWKNYKDAEAGNIKDPGIPFCISELDRITHGGIRRGQICLFYGGQGGYKTTFKANLAYNFSSVAKKDVMVITLEVSMDDYTTIIDSRNAMLEFSGIHYGKLNVIEKETYRQSLINQFKTKPSLYIVDIPGGSTSADVIKELELYSAKYGKYPDVLIIDYINEMEPVYNKWNNTSEKYKMLGIELRRIARSYNIAIVSSMQENRDGKKVKKKEESDLSSIGESHYFANVPTMIFYIFNTPVEDSVHILHIGVHKNRYGESGVTLDVFVNKQKRYIGDTVISLSDGDEQINVDVSTGVIN